MTGTGKEIPPCGKCGQPWQAHRWDGACRRPPGARTPLPIIVVTMLLGGVMLAAFASFTDPHLNFPVVSQVVCSARGDTWYGGGILGAPGCYAPSP